MSDLPNNLGPTDNTKAEKPKEQHEGLISEFLHSAAYAAVQEPIKGVSQLVDHIAGTKLAQSSISNFISAPEKGSGTADWMAQQLGGAAGMLLPFMLVKGSARGLMGESIKGTETAATLGMSLKEAGLTGFIYDAALKPTDANAPGNFWVNRGLSGVSGAATFMTLTGSAYGMGKLSNFAESKAIGTSSLVPLLRNPISAGILSGVPAGLVSAEGSSLVNQHRLATGQEIGGSIAGMSFVGGIFGANEFVKAKYTDGQSVAGFVAGKARAWAKPAEVEAGPTRLAGGDTVSPEGAKFSVADDGTPLNGTKAAYFDKLITRPEDATLKESAPIGTGGAGVVKADVYNDAEGKTWRNYELTRPDGTKANFEMVRTQSGDAAYVYREGNNQLVVKFDGGWDYPKGISMPRGEATAKVHVRTDSAADMVDVYPIVTDALINDPVLKPLVAGWKSQPIVEALRGGIMGEGERSKAFTIFPKNEEATQEIASRLNVLLSQNPLREAVDNGLTAKAVGKGNRVTVTREAVDRSIDSSAAQPLARLDDPLAGAIKSKLGLKPDEQPTDAQLREVEGRTGLQPGLLGIDREGALVMKVSPGTGDHDNYRGGVYLPDTGTKAQDPGSYTDRRAYYELARNHGLEPTKSHLDGAMAKIDDAGAPSMRKFKIQGVPTERAEDYRAGMKLLNDATRTGAKQEDLDAFIKYAQEARGVGLANGLRHFADQLDSPKPLDHEQHLDAHNLIDYAYAIPEARDLLKVASADEATATDRAAFEEYTREHGRGSTPARTFRDELATAAQTMKNADIAQALIDKAYAPRTVDIVVEPAQQAAFNRGMEILDGGLDAATLEKFAQPPPAGYGPGMEEVMSQAAAQLRLGPDAQIAILEAYHGAPMKEGIALLKADTLDETALKQFADGNGKALHAEMAGAAAELGLPPETQRALLEAYKGKQAWVDVEGTSINGGVDTPLQLPVPPEKEIAFLQGVELAKMIADPSSVEDLDPRLGAQHRELLRKYLASPDNAELVQPLIDYFKLADTYPDATQTAPERLQTARAGALLREAAFGLENERISSRPETVQINLPDAPQTPEWANRVSDFDDLANELGRASKANVEEARTALMNWMDRNPDMVAAGLPAEYARQSADSRVVSAIDSYLGSNNMEPFFEGKAKYEKVADTITPELIDRINLEGQYLYDQLLPPAPKEPVMWGGETHASELSGAYKIDVPDPLDGEPAKEKVVTAHFKRSFEGISEIEDRPDGSRVTTYNDETATKTDVKQKVQNPNGETILVQPDGSWHSELSNGNLIEEFVPGHVRPDGQPTNVVRHIRENGVDTYLYRDGTVETGKDGQFASTADQAAREQREETAEQQDEQQARQPANANVNQLAAKLAADSSATYREQNVAAIELKDHFGDMSDKQFSDWLEFARGTHMEGSREITNWQKLQTPGIETLIHNQSIVKLMGTVEGRDTIRNFLASPESATDTRLQLSDFLSNREFAIPPENWPEWLLNDVRARFKSADGSSPLPDHIQQYLNDHPERTEQLDGEKYPPRPVTMRRDDLGLRLSTLATIAENVPPQLREPLLRLGAEDARATADVIKIFTPGVEKDRDVVKAYTDLLTKTVPNAPDIYAVRTMLNAIKQVGYAAKNTSDAGRLAESQNQAVAMDALAHMSSGKDGASQILSSLIAREKEFAARSGGDKGKGGRDRGDRGDRGGDRGDRSGRDGRNDDPRNRGRRDTLNPAEEDGPGPMPQGTLEDQEEAVQDTEEAKGDGHEEDVIPDWNDQRDGIPGPD